MDTSAPATSTPTRKTVKPRFKWTPQQIEDLNTVFAVDHHPSQQEMEKLAIKHSADVSNVKSWFANRRTKEKRNSVADGDEEWVPGADAKTTKASSATNVDDDLSSIPSVIPSAGVPNSHVPILETDVPKLHARIKELEAENYHLKQQLAKRQREPDVQAPPAKKNKKEGKSESERLFHAWGKRLSTQVKTVKFYNSYETADVVVEESLTKELFKQCFVGKGTTVQPTSDNKPKSKVWIIQFPNWDAIIGLFGEGNIKKDGHIAWIWSRGGVPQRGFGFFGGGGGFSKSDKIRKTTAQVNSLVVQYNETHSKLQLKFDCRLEGGGGGMWGGYDSDE